MKYLGNENTDGLVVPSQDSEAQPMKSGSVKVSLDG